MAKRKTAGKRSGRKRRGQGEDMTEANANAVEVRTPIQTGELKLPEPDDYDHHKKSILGALEKKRTADGMYRNALKKAQAAGIDTSALLQANAIVRANDPKKTAQNLMQLAFALQQEGFPIEITVKDTLANEHADAVYQRFYADGVAGKTLVNPYPENSDLAAVAARGWRHGQAKNLGVSPEDSDRAIAGEQGEGADQPELEPA